MTAAIDHLGLYRLPWSLTDNPIAWLEPTKACNLACDGCYRQNVKDHKSIDEVQERARRLRPPPELRRRLDRRRRSAHAPGGRRDRPPRHARWAARPSSTPTASPSPARCWCELKDAGLVGFTFHVDSQQGRPDLAQQDRGADERAAPGVRRFGRAASAISRSPSTPRSTRTRSNRCPTSLDVGRRATSIASTRWSSSRTAPPQLEGFDYYANGKKADMSKLVYTLDAPRKTDISARDVAAGSGSATPTTSPARYLNGTYEPESFKWLLGMRIGTQEAHPRLMRRQDDGGDAGRPPPADRPLHELRAAGEPQAGRSRSCSALGRSTPACAQASAPGRARCSAIPSTPCEKQHLQAVV